MTKLVLADVSNLLGSPTAAANTLNSNNALIEAALENTLSRDGTTPNQMSADIDMNHNDILNADNVYADTLYLQGQPVIPGDVVTIPDNSIGTAQLKDNSVTLAKMADNSVGTAELVNGSVTVPKLHAQVANRLIEFDIRDSRFAGGAPWNGIDNDTPAATAAYAYFATLGGLNQYQGANAAVLHMPRGVGKISNLDTTSGTNVILRGESESATTIVNGNNNPSIFSTNVTGTNDAFRMGFENFTIYGPGRANANAHGLDLGAINNGRIENVRFYACRDALRVRNNWQTLVNFIKVDGGSTVGGSLTCYNGIVMLDGVVSVVENCLKVTGGVISGCENWGFRGQSVCGSQVTGLEILACGAVGMYLGDSPGGKDLKWFSCYGCLFDSCGELLIIHRGGSTVGTQMNFSGMWMGNTTTAGGHAINLQGIDHCSFQADTIANVDYAFSADAIANTKFDFGKIDTYDKSLVGTVPIVLNNSVSTSVRGGPMKKASGSTSTLVLAETGTTDISNIQGINGDGGMTIIGTNSIVKGNNGFKTQNYGPATILSGTSSIVINHGLGRTPVRGQIQVTPHDLLSAAGVTSFNVVPTGSTQLTITTNANVSANLGFDWFADVSRG